MEPTDDREAMRRWVETWKRTGEELDRMKWEELRAMTEEEAAARLDLQDWPSEDLWRSPDRLNALGMIEQQRLFSKASGLSAHR